MKRAHRLAARDGVGTTRSGRRRLQRLRRVQGELHVGKAVTRLRTSMGSARGTSPRLARGHARAVVVLTAPGIRLTASRPVVIR